MRFSDPHIHMVSRTTDDYENMAAAGVRGVVEPAFWQGQPRRHVGSFIDYFDTLIGWERFRASQFGIRHYCTMGLNPKEANSIELAEAVMAELPRFCEKRSAKSASTTSPRTRNGSLPSNCSWRSTPTSRCSSTLRTGTRRRAPNARSPWCANRASTKSGCSSTT